MPSATVVFGNEVGLPRLLRLLPREAVLAAVRASDRPGPAAELEALAEREGVELLVQPPAADPAYPAFLDRIRALRPDLLLVDAYSMRLRPELLEIASRGGINVHGALLPRHRGANPTQWAIIDGDRETGVTIHHMTADFDAGDIVVQAAVPIADTDTWLDVHAKLEPATEALLDEHLPAILDGTSPRRPQGEDTDPATPQRPRRAAEDGRIPPDTTVREAYNLIRALVAPHPGAFLERDGERIVVDRFLTMEEVAHLLGVEVPT